jgi:hypothetical protein
MRLSSRRWKGTTWSGDGEEDVTVEAVPVEVIRDPVVDSI